MGQVLEEKSIDGVETFEKLYQAGPILVDEKYVDNPCRRIRLYKNKTGNFCFKEPPMYCFYYFLFRD